MPSSPLEAAFRQALYAAAPGLMQFMCEQFRFAPPRRWRSDFAFPCVKILVEIDGTGGYSRHRSLIGFSKDCEKTNAATVLGYATLRYDTISLKGEGLARCVAEVVALVRERMDVITDRYDSFAYGAGDDG